MRWEMVKGSGEGPGTRWGHTCNAVNGGRFLYLFGGYNGTIPNFQTNQVHIFDTLLRRWSKPTMKGRPPLARDSHSCSVIDDNLFVFGGIHGTMLLNDLYIMDTSSHTWITPAARGEGPSPREGHGAAVVGKRLYVFGGCGRSADNVHEVYYNDLYIFNTETFTWSRAITSGSPPCPREGLTCSSWKNKIVVMGGQDDIDVFLCDVHILDTDTLIWRELRISGQSLPTRAGHSTVSFGKSLFAFGGFSNNNTLYNDLHKLDMDTGVWTRVTTTSNVPSARFCAAADCLDPFWGGVLVFSSGCSSSLEGLDDMHFLHTGIARESEQRPEKLSLRKQLKLKCQEQNLVQIPVPSAYGGGAGSSVPMAPLNYNQPSRQHIPVNQPLPPLGKNMFQARVTGKILDGLKLETVIDGKPLVGVVFPNSMESQRTNTSSRKRDGSIVSYSTAPKMPKLGGKEDRPELQGDSSRSHEHCKEGHTTVLPSDPTTAAETCQASINPEPENGGEENDTPNSSVESLKKDGANNVICSEGGVQTNDQTNMPILNYEVPSLVTHDQMSDAPNCNPDVQKPAAAEGAVCPSNQGVTEDSTTTRTEGNSEPDKLT